MKGRRSRTAAATAATRYDVVMSNRSPDDDADAAGPAPATEVQLGLFTPDRTELEGAHERLDRLDLDGAESLFRGILDRDPSSADAREGLAAVAHWRRVAAEVPSAALDRADALWAAVRGCPPRLISRRLRRRILNEVLELLEVGSDDQSTAEVCAGEVLHALGRGAAAHAWCEWACRRMPGSGRLWRLEGDLLWTAEASEAARRSYSRGLLLDPVLPEWSSVAWPELARAVRRSGAAATAMEWWASFRLPLPPLDVVGDPHPAVAGVWRALAEAEDARSKGVHEAVLRARSRLREQAPVLFELYMAALEG